MKSKDEKIKSLETEKNELIKRINGSERYKEDGKLVNEETANVNHI